MGLSKSQYEEYVEKDIRDRIRELFKGLGEGSISVCEDCLSANFGKHFGRDSRAMIEHGIDWYKKLPDAIKSSYDNLSVQAFKDDSVVYYYLYLDDGRLLSSGWFHLDGDNMLQGNGFSYAIFPTILFRNEKVIRALQFDSVDRSNIRVSIPESRRAILNLEEGFIDEHLTTCIFSMPDDKMDFMDIRVSVLNKAGKSWLETIRFPGVNRPSYAKLFPRFEKNILYLDHSKHVLSRLVVELDDGRVRSFDYPNLDEMAFGSGIKRARITDALNFQWERIDYSVSKSNLLG